MSACYRTVALQLALLAGIASLPGAASADTCMGLDGKLAAVVANGSTAHVAIISPFSAAQRPLFAPPSVEASFSDPSFSCDGRRLVYAGSAGGSFIEVADALSGEKVVAGQGGGAQTFPQPPFPMPGMTPANPTFLTSGKIVFSSLPGPGSAPTGTYVVDPDGSHLRRLFAARSLAVANEGRWFIAGFEGGAYTLRNEKGRSVPWSHLRLSPSSRPSFSANGGEVVFVRGGDVYVVGDDGTGRLRLTHDGRAGSAVFSPNGQWVAFSRSSAAPGAYDEVVVYLLGRYHRTRVVARFPAGESVGGLAWAPRVGASGSSGRPAG